MKRGNSQEKLLFILLYLWFYQQGPLEKCLQNSVAFERQKNMDNRVGIIRGSVQVTETHVRWERTENIGKNLKQNSPRLVDGPGCEVHRGHARRL